MGREQGDDLEVEVDYVHPDHPEWGVRPAYTPADSVNLRARGWRAQETKQPQAQPTSAPSTPAAPSQPSTANGQPATPQTSTGTQGAPSAQPTTPPAADQKPAGS